MNGIKKTNRYQDFKRIKGNRLINPNHLARLKKSIQHKDLLHLNPIIVNDKKEVIDGQHRLQACMDLNKPVYYIVGDGLGFEDVVYMNTTIKDWSIGDYLESYIELGYKDYIELKKFAKRWDFSISNAMAICNTDGVVNRAGYAEFKNGGFEIANIDFANDFAEKLRDIVPYCTKNTWKDRDFIRALSKAYELGLEHDKLMTQIQQFPQPLHRRANVTEYLRQFEDIYNYNRGSAKPVRLY